MKYAMIAAGEGSRLAAEGIDAPKPLVKVGGECLIDRLIRIFMQQDAEEIVCICNDHTALVGQHLAALQRDGLMGRPVPLRFVVKSTPSSMHSFFEISKYLLDGPFVLTTVDTIFREDEFAAYIDAFRQCRREMLMGVTDYIDDERPLYVDTDSRMNVTAFLDTLPESPTTHHKSPSTLHESPSTLHESPSTLHESPSTLHESPSTLHESRTTYISGGIYGLQPEAIFTLNNCISRAERRMRNFQRALLADRHPVKAWPFSKVLDIDHASDIQKAEQFLQKK